MMTSPPPNTLTPHILRSKARLSGLTCLGHNPTPRRDLSAVSGRTRARLLELGLLHDEEHARKYDQANFAELSAWVYPTATLEQLQVCHDWHMWLFCFDDRVDSLDGRYAGQLDEMKKVAVQALISLRYGVEHPEPLAAYALQIRNALRSLASDRWLLDFCDSVEDYLFNGTFVAAHHHREQTVPSVDEFIRFRTADSGLGTVIRLAEMLAGDALQDVWHDPDVRRLRTLCAEASALHNDLFSYEKEVIWNQCPNNLVYAVMVERGVGFPEAAAWCIQLINDRYHAFLRGSARALAQGGERAAVLRPFIAGMRVWIEGSADWEYRSGRYCSPTSPFVELARAR